MGDEPSRTDAAASSDTQPNEPPVPERASLERLLPRDTLPRPHRARLPDRRTSQAHVSQPTHADLLEVEPDVPLEVGDRVDHFQIMRLLGRGGMGEVYVARDTQLGRRVALKLIHPKYLGSPDAIAGFLAEARTTAKFNHPHIVTIHGVGAHEGRPYVALEYLEGDNLRKRMLKRRLTLQATLRIALAVAEALGQAHRGGVLHLDLKPENVMIPEDGRVRVVDFGLARQATLLESGEVRADDDRTGVWGTPAYMAPEQWLRKKPTAATDVWGLGMMLFELCSDWLPYDLEGSKTKLMNVVIDPEPVPRIERFAEVPTDVADLIAQCLEKDRRKRPKVAEVAESLRELLFRSATRPAEDEGPFRGLLPFTERHQSLFFGREAEVAAFVERVRLQPVLPVVGPSGVGKTSFVQAGVVPRLREEGSCVFVNMRPGTKPLESLASRLVRADRETSNTTKTASAGALNSTPSSPSVDNADAHRLAEAIREAPHRLGLELQRIAAERDARVVLFVDQVEELFTLCADAADRRAFMEAICTAADDPEDPVRVIFAVRDVYLGRLAMGPVVTRALTQVTVIQTLRHMALERTLLMPLRSVGYRFEDDELVTEMVNSVGDAPGALPMLQFAARQLWEQRDNVERILVRGAYHEMGGVEGALAVHADGVVDGMSAPQLRFARELLMRLVTDDRARALLSKSDCLAGLAEEADAVLTQLTQARLVVVTKKARGDKAEAMLELSHDSLIDSWGTLKRWLDDSREELAFVHEAGQAANLWDKRGRRPEELWRGAALVDALHRFTRATTEIPSVTTAFLEAAQARERMRGRRKRWLFSGALLFMAALAAVSAIVAWVVRDKEREATRQRDLADRQRAATLREGARTAMNQGAVLEARAKLRLAIDVEDDPAARALWWQLSENPLVWSKKLGDRVFGVAFGPRGAHVAAGCADEAIYWLDATTRATRVLHGNGDQVLGVTVSSDGARLATISTGGKVRVWDVAGGTPTVLGTHTQRPTTVRFDGTGSRLATASNDGTVRIWEDLATGSAEPHVVTIGDEVGGADWHPKRNEIAAVSGSDLLFIDASRNLRRVESGHDGALHAVRYSPDGSRIAIGGADGRISLWRDGKAIHLVGHTGAVWAVAFDASGERLASGGDDGALRIWDVAGETLVRSLTAHSAQITGVDLSDDGRHAVTSSFDGSVRLWDLDAGGDGPLAAEPATGARGLAFSPDGETLAAGSYDGRIRLWSVANGSLQRTFAGHGGRIFEVAYSHDGAHIASTSADRTARLWDVSSGVEEQVLAGHSAPVVGVAFSPDDERIATGSKDGTVGLWDLDKRTHRFVTGHLAEVGGVAFNDDGSKLASGGERVRIWNATSGALERELEGHVDSILGLRFRNHQVVTGSTDGTVRMWNTVDGTGEVVGRHPQRVYWLDVFGDRISASGSDGAARIWTLGNPDPLVLRGHADEVNNAVFSPDGQLVATASDDGTIRVWRATDGRPHWRAPALLAQPPMLLSHRGWVGLGGAESRPLARPWIRAIESRARWAEQVGEHVCLQDREGAVELWRVGGVGPIARSRGPVDAVAVVSGGCLMRAADGVVVLRTEGTPMSLEGEGVASAVGGHKRFVAAFGREIRHYDADGTASGSWRAAVGITAVGSVGEHVIAGYRDGHLELFRASQTRAASLGFRGVPSSSVERIVEGPSGTIAAGYANGFVGLWSLRDGALLASTHLHGHIAHLVVADRKLMAASDLGAHVTWDLEAFFQPYCDLVRRVWQSVPVVWEGGQAVARAPSRSHTCSLDD